MFFTSIVFLSALMLEALGGYMSVIGLSSKSSLLIILLAIILDFSKIVIASVLYKNWKDINWLFKAFLLPTLIFLITINSYGSYAYLLQEFGKTTASSEKMEARIALLEKEQERLLKRKEDIDSQISSINPKNVNQKRRLMESFSSEINHINQRIIEIDKELPQAKTEQTTQNLETGTLISLSKAWGVSTQSAAKIISFMMVIVIDPLAIVLLTVGNMLVHKRKDIPKPSLATEEEKGENVLFPKNPNPPITPNMEPNFFKENKPAENWSKSLPVLKKQQ